MKRRALTLLTIFLAGPAAAQSGVSPAAMAQAGRTAQLRAIDYGESFCDSDMTVETWLKTLAGTAAKSITWLGGRCQIVGIGPGIDAQSHAWCARAEITLARPLSRQDTPLVEIFLERPRNGKPGPAYAFRAIMTSADGPDMIRRRRDFAAAWRERFPPKDNAAGCRDD